MPTEISNGESGLSIRTKLNTLFSTVETTVDNRLSVLESGAALANINVYSSRSALVSAWTNGLIANGGLVSDGNVLYEALLDATDISDLTGLIPFGQIDLRHFTSAAGDGTTSITAALQAAITYAANSPDAAFSTPGNNRSIYIPAGLWLWDDHDSDGVMNIIRKPVTIYSDGPNTGTLVCNITDKVGFLVQPEVDVDGYPVGTVSNVNFFDLTLYNTLEPTNPTGGQSPLFTADSAGIQYDKSMGTVQNCLINNFGGGVDCLASPEGVKILNTDVNTFNDGTGAGSPVVGTAHVRIKVRRVNVGASGTKYIYNPGTGDEYYGYSNSVFIDNLNLRAGADPTFDRHEATILIEGVDGAYITNSHVAWGDLSCFLIQPRHPLTPCTNIQVSNCLIDPFPGKSSHGVLIRDNYTIGTTPASDFTFSNCSLAGCTAEGVYVNLDINGFTWVGGAIKGVGTGTETFPGSGIYTGSAGGMRFSDDVTSVNISNVTFRNVGRNSNDPCIWIEDANRVTVDNIVADGGTYGVVKVTAGSLDVKIGSITANTITGGTTIEIPSGTSQVKINEPSHIAESNVIDSATAAGTITPALGENFFRVTGTTAINTVSGSVLWDGRIFTLVFSDALTLTEAGNLYLGGHSIITEPGKAYQFVYSLAQTKVCLIGTPSYKGTWTPVLTDGTTAATMSAQEGHYEITNGMVHLTGRIVCTDITGMSGALRITGYPVAPVRTGGGNVHYASGLNLGVAGNGITVRAGTGVSYLQLMTWDTVAGPTGLTAAEITATAVFEFEAHYSIV